MYKKLGYISPLHPGRVPVMCGYGCDWEGYVILARGQRIDSDGCRLVDSDGKERLMICPKCKRGGSRAYFYKADKPNETGGQVLFLEDLPMSKKRYTADLYISDLNKSSF